MGMNLSQLFRKSASAGVTLAAVLLAWVPATEARVTKIVIDDTQPLAGQAIAYQQISGRAFGELDPSDPHNAIIQDLRPAQVVLYPGG